MLDLVIPDLGCNLDLVCTELHIFTDVWFGGSYVISDGLV